MSVVYRGEKIGSPGPEVALKLLSPRLTADAWFRERFEHDLARARELRHPSVVEIYDTGSVEGMLFVAAQYVPGGDLGARLDESGPIDLERAAAIADQLAAALDAAHAHGLVHRNVKPSNVLLQQDERVCLCDFGGADHSRLTGLTDTSHLFGNVDYTAPEQIEGGSVDARTDVYGLGCLLYEALTGSPPYERGSPVERMHAHLADPPPRASASKPGVPQTVDEVIARALAKQPDERFSSCGELAAGLREAAAPQPRGAPTLLAPQTAPQPEIFPESAGDEVRPVTVLFADLVGSTGLGERLRPEEVKSLMGGCMTRMSSAVETFGGSVQAYQGDGICAYFGVPDAHEDDPARAARAGLRILETLKRYARDIRELWGIPEFDVRIGINTGHAAVGRVGAASPQAVALGDVANVAARLEKAAEPGTVLVGEQTAASLAGGFELEPLDPMSVRGRETPVRAFRLAGAAREERPARETPFVGRLDELDTLEGALRELDAGRGQALLVTGDPGIGKARLLAEARARASTQLTWLEAECASYDESGFGPFVEILRRWLGVDADDPALAVRTKLQARLEGTFGESSADVLAPLGRLLGVVAETGATLATGDRLATDIARAYQTWLETLARERPVVVALTNLHWASRLTRKLAEAVLELVDRAPVLLVTTMEPGIGSEASELRRRMLTEYAHRSREITLGPLAPEGARRLAASLVPAPLDAASLALLAERAEGNPLFLEEMISDFLERGDLERHRTWTVTLASPKLLPPSLELVLLARIDRLPDEPRGLLQTAAAVGRTFPRSVVEHIHGGEHFSEHLTLLLRTGMIREHRRSPELEYAFRHGLLHQAALSTLTAARRTRLYRDVAAAVEHVFASSLGDWREQLAHYYAQTGDLGQVVSNLEAAADRAFAAQLVPVAGDLLERAAGVAARNGDLPAAERLRERLQAIEGVRAVT